MASQKFSASARLHARAEFLDVQNTGRRVSARFVTLLGKPNTRGRDRLGIVASRRVGGAVIRNRAKRRLREVFRQYLSAETAAPGPPLDLVVIARTGVVDAPFDALRADFQAALRKLRGAR